MVKTQVTSYPTQVHPIHIQLEGFSAHFFGIGPWFGVGRVLDLAKHATIALAATVGFPSSVLAFCAMTFGTLDHAYIIAQVLATPLRPYFPQKGCFMVYSKPLPPEGGSYSAQHGHF
jgi:hypothetical protein